MARLFQLVSTFCLAALLGFSCPGYSAEFSPKSHFYQIEYLKPTSGNVSFIYITFSTTVSPDLAESFLRQELDRAANYSSPKGDILAYALYADEKNIKLSDGSSFMIYMLDTKHILTEKECDVALKPKAKSGNAIHVSINVFLKRNSSGKIRVSARTNLPDNMKFMIGLRNREIGYFAQDKVSVSDGIFESNWFSNRGNALPSGTYEVNVSSPIPDFQPDSVKRIIGNKGENLIGGMIVSSFGSNRIELNAKKRVD